MPPIVDDAGSGIVWSHDALRRAELFYPLRNLEQPPAATDLRRYLQYVAAAKSARRRTNLSTAERLERRLEHFGRRLEDPRHPANVLIPEPQPAPGTEPFAQLPPLTLAVIAFWLYGLPPALQPTEVTEVLALSALQRCETVLAAIIALDHPTDAEAANGRTSEQAPTGDQEDVLTRALDEGLARLEGQRLLGLQPTLYLHLLSRGYQPGRLRLCERCQLVHQARRARACSHCRKSPHRIQPKPWHRRIIIGSKPSQNRTVLKNRDGRTLTGALTLDRRPPQTLYIGTCQQCADEFRSGHALTRYCQKCATPASRVARSRQTHSLAELEPLSDGSDPQLPPSQS